MERNRLAIVTMALVFSVLSTVIISGAPPSVNVWEEDFESYTVGTFPDPPWALWFDGQGSQNQEIIDTVSVSGDKSLKLWGLDNWGAHAAKPISIPEEIGYEVMIRAENFGLPNKTGAFIALGKNVGYGTWGWGVVSFNSNGSIESAGQNLQAYDLNTWYKVTVIFDATNNTHSVWIDDVLKETSLPNEHPPVDIEALVLGSDHAEQICYFDDVRVFEVQIDTTPPNISLLSPENKTYSTFDIPLTFTVDEPPSWIGYSLDYQANVTTTGNMTLTNLAKGSHNIVVYANDTSGNMGASEKIIFTVAISPPEYTLTVHSSPDGVSFIVDNASHTTSWTETYNEGASVSLETPEIHIVGDARYYWDQWSDGNKSRSRTVTMNTNITLTAHYSEPYYELAVTSSPVTEVTFTINGTQHATPYTEWLLEAIYTLEMPETHNENAWSHWLEDGDTSRTKSVSLDTSIRLTAVFAPVRPTAAVNIHPETLNLKSKGKWITCHIELPEGFDVGDIDRATILLNNSISVDPLWMNKPIGSEGVQHLMVKFSRKAVSEFILSKGITYGHVTLSITGELYDDTSFEGSDIVRVKMPGRK